MNPDNLSFDGYVAEILPTGSRVICNPPPVDTDRDYLLYCYPENVERVEDALKIVGFKIGGSMNQRKKKPLDDVECTLANKPYMFHSWKKGDLNLIVTVSREYFERFTFSTNIAKDLNLMDKRDRIMLFENICYRGCEGIIGKLLISSGYLVEEAA